MFAQILDTIGQKFSWLQENERFSGLFNTATYKFPIETFSETETNDCIWLLQEIGLHPKIKTENDTSFITLSAKDYQQFQQALDVLYEPFNLFSPDVPYRPDLINEYSFYNDVNEDLWDFISNYIQIKTDNTSQDDTPENIQKNKEKVLKCLDMIKHNMGDTISNNRIINELIFLYQSFGDSKQYLPDLVIDLTTKTQEHLKKHHANGNASNENNDIGIRTDAHLEPHHVTKTFLHEIRHITQKYHLLSQPAKEDEIVSSCQDFIRILAREAEAKAYSLLILRKENAFVDDIVNNHTRHIETQLKQKQIQLPNGKYKTPAQKLAGITHFIQAEAEKRTVQTLCNIYLAPNRYSAYTILKSDKIILPAAHFNEMMKSVVLWKRFYFNTFKEMLISDSQFNDTNHEHESIIIEQRWKDQSEIVLNLAPKSIFSEQVATNLGIYKSIYGESPLPLYQTEPLIYYTGITPQLVHQAEDCWAHENYDKIKRIYQQIQKKNPFLPTVECLYQHDELPMITAGRLLKSLQDMGAHKDIREVLQTLGFNTYDVFDGLTIQPEKENKTNTDFERIRQQLNRDVKKIYDSPKQNATQDDKSKNNLENPSLRIRNPLSNIAR